MNAQRRRLFLSLIVGLSLSLTSAESASQAPADQTATEYGAGAYAADTAADGSDVSAPPAPPAPAAPSAPPAPSQGAQGVESNGKMVDDTGSTNALLPATPLFAASKATTGEVKQEKVMPRKEMFAKTENEERRAREIVARIDTVKSTKLNEYLTLDKELDGEYEAIGLARGHAADDILDIKESLWADVLERNQVDANDVLQGKIAATKQKLDKLEGEVERLTEREGDVVARLKELSDETTGAFDKAAQMFNKRSELPGIINDQTAQMIFDQIKAAPDAIAEIEKGMTKPEGVVPRLEKAIADARAQMNVVKGLLAELKTEDVDVADSVAQGEQRDAASQDLVPEAEEGAEMNSADVDDEAPVEKPKKKGSKKKKSSWFDWLSTDLFSQAYHAVAATGQILWDSFKPVRILFVKIYTHLKTKVVGGAPASQASVSGTVKDPVLARIEIERQQSQTKVNELEHKRRLIREKEELLDRLEVERVMQLDGKDAVDAHLEHSYRRGARKELSWLDLGKRFIWKTYASFRRGVSRLAQWWHEARAESSGKRSEKDTKAKQSEQGGEPVSDEAQEPAANVTHTVGPQETQEVSDFDALYRGADSEEAELDDADDMMSDDTEEVTPESAVAQALSRRQYKLTPAEETAKAFAESKGDKAELAADMMMDEKEQEAAAQRAASLATSTNAAVQAVQKSATQAKALTAPK